MDNIEQLIVLPIAKIGNTQTTVGSWLAVLGVLLATLIIAWGARRLLRRFLTHATDHEVADPGFYNLLLQIVIWLIGLELALHLIGIRLTTLLAASGFLALAAGFALKNIVENFLSGIILRAEKTILPGDLITVHDRWLRVNHIGLRTLVARDIEDVEILIPNSTLAQSTVQNITRSGRQHLLRVTVGVAYESDLELVRSVLEETADTLEWRSRECQTRVYLKALGDSSVIYEVHVWIEDAINTIGRTSDLYEAIWWALKDNRITIAYNQLDVHIATGTENAPPAPGG